MELPDLPRLLLFTDSSSMRPTWDGAILEACLGGAKWLCAREKHLPPRQVSERILSGARVTEKFGARLFAHDRADLARAVHADGLHLPENGLSVAMARATLGFHTPIGASVHSLESALQAQDEGATYVVFGSIWPTPSHPGQEGQGLDALERVCAALHIPVLAIGGVSPERASECLERGAHGVAAISGVWNGNVKANVRAFRLALGERDAPLSHGLAGQLQN